MKRTLRTTLVGLTCLCWLLTGPLPAETKVRPYADPGYRQMGIYAGGPGWIDYEMAKLSLGDEFPNKKQWWANLKAARKTDPRRHDIWIIYPGMMVGGHATSVRLVQRVSAPRPMKELTVTVQGYVNTKNLGGHLDLGVAPRGEEIRWQTSTDEKEGGVHSGLALQIPPEELGDLRDFDVHIILRSTSGVESGDRDCANVSSLKIEGK